MADPVSVRLDKTQKEGLEAMSENDDAANPSEALRVCVNIGLQECGYANGVKVDTALRQTARRFADTLAGVALVMLGVTMLYPVEFRVFVFGPLMASIACYGLDRVLAKKEPGVSNWLRGLLSRGEAA